MAVSIVGTKFRAWNSSDGSPLAFGKVYTYQAGTNTPKATYTTEGQETENANPVILNAAGYANIYLDGSYKIVVTDADDVEVHTTDPVTDPSRLGKEWVSQLTAVHVSSSSFTVSGNETSIFLENRAVRVKQDSGFIYGYVDSSSYSSGTGLTTVNLASQSSLDGSVEYAEVSILESSSSIPWNVFSNSEYDDVDSFVSSAPFEDVKSVHIKSFYSWNIGSGEPSGSLSVKKTGGTNTSPSAGTAVSISSIGGFDGSGSTTGQSAQWGYFWDANGDEWQIVIENNITNIKSFGAIGDDTEDTAPMLEAASSYADVCIHPNNNGEIYRYTATPTLPSGFTTIFYDRNSLTGKSPSQVNAIFIRSGSLSGFAISPEMDREKLHIIAGTIRQDSSARTNWGFIKDANHEPMGVDDSSPAIASGSEITVPFDRTFDQVGGIVCGGDETLSNVVGLKVGASVGLSDFVLKASVDLSLSAHIRFNGSSWSVLYGDGQGGSSNHNVEITSVTYSGGNITINHQWIPGTALALTPHSNNGAVVPYHPVIKSQSNTQTVVNLLDSAGSLVTSAADTKMSFQFLKHFSKGIALDGTDNGDTLDLDLGNIWFVGFMIESIN